MRIPIRGYNVESRLLNAIIYLEEYQKRNKDIFERYYSKPKTRYRSHKKPTTIVLLEELKKIKNGK